MHVGRVMKTSLVKISPETSLLQARDMIAQHRISHLLVVDDHEKLLGIVSDRDLKESWASPAIALSVHELKYLLDRLTVGMIMAKTVISVSSDTTIERAAMTMQEKVISSLPVVDDGRLVEILTRTDVMGVLLQAIGIDGDSTRMIVLVNDRIGVMAEVSNILRDEQINIRSIVSWPLPDHQGVFQLVMRVAARDGLKAVAALENGGFKVMTAYVKDITPFMPEN